VAHPFTILFIMSETEATQPADDSTPEVLKPELLKRALKAFKKRLKLTRLDVESSLGVGPMSGGRSSGIVAISPPDQYPQAVWDVLVAEGKLRKVSHGQYDLV